MTHPIRMVSVPEDALDALKHCVENEKAHWSLSGETEACVDVPVKDLRAIVDALTAAPVREEGGAVAWACITCNSPRAVDPCQKCGSALTKSADGWEWPRTPDVDRIRALAREVGYAIGVHGTQERDLDLIAAPWVADAVTPLELAQHIATGLGGSVLDYKTQDKPCGRWSCNINADGWFKLIDLSVMPALTTREEAPAEAGEDWPTLADLHTIKGWLYGLSTAPDLTDVVADGGVSVGDCYQQEAREFAGRIERIIAALRAQPQAREDAGVELVSNGYKFDEEIAWLREASRYFAARETKGEDRAHWANVYNAENARKLADRLAELSSNPCQLEAPDALRAQPQAREGEAVAWRCSRDHASDGNGQWFYHDGPPRPSPLARNVQPLYTHPAPDALRIAVEALEAIKEVSGDRAASGYNETGRLARINDRCDQVLAALQAEQKGGA